MYKKLIDGVGKDYSTINQSKYLEHIKKGNNFILQVKDIYGIKDQCISFISTNTSIIEIIVKALGDRIKLGSEHSLFPIPPGISKPETDIASVADLKSERMCQKSCSNITLDIINGSDRIRPSDAATIITNSSVTIFVNIIASDFNTYFVY